MPWDYGHWSPMTCVFNLHWHPCFVGIHTKLRIQHVPCSRFIAAALQLNLIPSTTELHHQILVTPNRMRHRQLQAEDTNMYHYFSQKMEQECLFLFSKMGTSIEKLNHRKRVMTATIILKNSPHRKLTVEALLNCNLVLGKYFVVSFRLICFTLLTKPATPNVIILINQMTRTKSNKKNKK